MELPTSQLETIPLACIQTCWFSPPSNNPTAFPFNYTGLPALIRFVMVAFGFVHAAMSEYLFTIRSLTILPNTTLPHTFKCVWSVGVKLYTHAASSPISLQ